MNALKLVVALSSVLMIPISVLAQSTSTPGDKPNVFLQREPKVDKSRLRDVKGVVKDELDQPVDAAIVQLTDLKSGKIVNFRTKEDGRYLFYDLNMDQNYELKVIRDGYVTTAIRKLTKYDVRKPAVINFELQKSS